MVAPELTKKPSHFCWDCGAWYVGAVKEVEYLDSDYEEGTPLSEVETYTSALLGCGCNADDVSYREADHYWKCASCQTNHGDNLPDAIQCCSAAVRRAVKHSSNHEIVLGGVTFILDNQENVKTKQH